MDGNSKPATLDNGFNVIARDLDRAFALGLSPNQAVIVNMIREQSWDARRQDGQRRPAAPVKVNVTHLARDTGLNRSRLSTALKGLVAGRILAETPDGFLIEKDYRKWLADDAPAEGAPATHARFTATELRYIRAAKSSAKGGSDKQPATVAKRNSEVLQNATPETNHCCETQHQLLRNATPTVAECNSATKEDAPARSGEGRDRENHTHTAAGLRSQPIREADDAELVREAARILAGDQRTAHLGQRLLQEHNTPDLLPLEGWRFVLAANKQVGPSVPHHKKMGWGYYLAIARNASEAERDTPGEPAPGRAPARPASPNATSARVAQTQAAIRDFFDRKHRGDR